MPKPKSQRVPTPDNEKEPEKEVEMEVDNIEMDGLDNVQVPKEFDINDYGPVTVPDAPETVATYDINGPRLMITQIKNENFKSYAGVQILGPFHKSFTSIVGPNGSGKSNVIDSMLFVFGYRANKIRSKKLSVLLHNSENHGNVDSCTVSVFFQKIIDTGPGDDEYTVVPNSQFIVSRTASRDNSSTYSIDGKRATYKDVTTFLRGCGIDLDHNRFLILQGEVEQIAMMKPKGQTEHDDGMLEFLEDIIGSNRFKEPIDILAKRVEQLNEFRVEKLNRVKAVEKEKDELEGSKNEAVEFLKIENSIVGQKNKLYQKYVLECTQNEEKATAEFNKINEGMEEVNTKMKEIKAAKAENDKEHKKIQKEYEKLNKICDDMKEKFSECEQKDVKCREDLKYSKGKAKKLEKQLEQEKKKIEELKLIPEQSLKAVEELKKKLEKLEDDKKKEEEKLKEVMDSLKTETQELQVQKDKKEEELLELQKAVNETKSKLNVAQSELSLLLSNQQKETARLNDMTKKLDNAEKTLTERQNGISQLKKKIPEVQNIVDKAKNDFQVAVQEETKVSEELRSIRQKVEEARSSMQASQSKGKVLGALLEQKKNGKIPGISGRLGDLGAIDDQYDVAISTACGALDNIVCDTITTAQKCVEFLKKNSIGSATFIGLDKMQRWAEHVKRKITTPENVPRLFDLVKVKDSTILPAFYHALRDTLVAKDLDQATRIAYGKTRYRVVTLQGQLIDTSGAMSGGGNTVSRGRMASSVAADAIDPKELAAMENKMKTLTTEAQQLRGSKEHNEDTVHKQEKELSLMKHSLEKFQMEIKGLTEQQTQLTSQIKDQQEVVKTSKPDPKHLEDLEKTVMQSKKEFEKANGAASKIENEVQSLHKQIMDIGGSKLKAVQARVDSISSQIDQVYGQITKTKVGVKTAERNLKKGEDKVASVEEEMKETEEKVEQLDKELQELEVEATKVLEEYQGAQEKMKAVGSGVEDIKTKVSKLEEDENHLQKESIEVKHELERYETIIKTNQQKIKHWKKEMSHLSVSKVDDMEVEELVTYNAEELETTNKENIQYEITVLEEKLAQMKPNMAAIAEYRKKEELYLKRVGELDQITDLRDEQRRYHEDLRKDRLDEFMNGFSTITKKLKEMYQMITLGGDAELELVDSLDPFSEGIVFSVRPPKKSWKNISNLSGGEKTLSSLALVFALHHYKPTPLYVMDEIDAALDFKNVSIVANYIKERTKNAQFIIISLRNNMFELADRLVGIYKTDNCTKSVTINPMKINLPLKEVNA